MRITKKWLKEARSKILEGLRTLIAMTDEEVFAAHGERFPWLDENSKPKRRAEAEWNLAHGIINTAIPYHMVD